MTPCENLKKWRGERSIEEISPLVGLSQSYISMLENGERDITKNVIDAYLRADPKYFKPADFFKGASQ